MKPKYDVCDRVEYKLGNKIYTGIIFAIRVSNQIYVDSRFSYLVSLDTNLNLIRAPYKSHFSVKDIFADSSCVSYLPVNDENSKILCEWIYEENIVKQLTNISSNNEVTNYGDYCKKCNTYNEYVETTGDYICWGCSH